MSGPLFKGVDCVLLRTPDLDSALAFYAGGLGHELIWRSGDAAGLRLPGTAAELVLHAIQGPEVDLLVDDVGEAVRRFAAEGGDVLEPPFEIAIGHCAVVRDPFGNRIVMLDQSKGSLVTDEERRVVAVEPAPPERSAQ